MNEHSKAVTSEGNAPRITSTPEWKKAYWHARGLGYSRTMARQYADESK